MDLPTYTNIWRIEKRLYKLYDVRLPMPLPINWIAVFTGITIPYVVLLIAIGLPFNHTLVWLYVLPPGVLTVLTTRSVIEGKRLPELLESQVRYLAEPRTWARLAPLSEKERMTVTAWVWRGRRPANRPANRPAASQADTRSRAGSFPARARRPGALSLGVPARRPVPALPAAASLPPPLIEVPSTAVVPPVVQPPAPAALRAAAPSAAEGGLVSGRGGARPVLRLEVSHDDPGQRSAAVASHATIAEPVAGSDHEGAGTGPDPAPALKTESRPEPEAGSHPVTGVKAVGETKQRAVPSIERALSGPSRDRSLSWNGKVKIVTGAGAHAGPGARDQEALDRSRARLPITEPRRILVLGCTSGAGQTVTTLLIGAMLASLREEPVAAVDVQDGMLARYRAPAAWLTEILAGNPPQQVRPARPDGLHPTPKPAAARLDVIASREPFRDGDEIRLAVQLSRHYPLAVLDPGAAALTRLLKVTDQLVLVVPASTEAAGALADTRDWLDAHGHADLAMQSVTVINGVSRRSLPDVEQAESVARGRSRAIVRVPWDDMLPVAVTGPSTLRPQTRIAYTALAGVLIAGMAAVPVRKKR